MPVYSFKGQRLCGFDRSDEKSIELLGPIEEILSQIHPKLSFAEVADLFQRLKTAEIEFSETLFMRQWGYGFTEASLASIEQINDCSEEFRNFAIEKGLSPRDLEPLSLGQDMSVELVQLSSFNCSKSEAVQIIELLVDLKMLGRLDDVDWKQRASDLLESLKVLRYPKRTAKSIESRKRAKRLSWPRGMKWTWKTNSDQNTLEIQLSAKSLQELGKLTEQLHKVVDQASSDEGNDPWQ